MESTANFINEDNFFEAFKGLYNDELVSCGYNPQQYEDYVDEYAWNTTLSTAASFRKYVHMADTHMVGNFCNIRQDWECCPEFIGSEVQPWGMFDDVVKSIDDGTISDDNLARFQTWAMDWYFTAFGTYNLKYNFITCFGEMIYQEEQNS